MKDTILERGKFIRKKKNPEALAFFPENKALVSDLFRKYRFEMIFEDSLTGDKEWVCVGSRGQVFEYGRSFLGISVEGTKRVHSFIRQTKDFTTVTQLGDGEANLVCAWTPENVKKLAKLLGLIKRRTDAAIIASGMS